jgi:hypothetical protein
VGRAIRGSALILLIFLPAAAMAGCGGHHRSAAELKLEREDLVAVARGLQRAEGPVRAEIAAAKRAWPWVVNGLPREPRVLSGVRDVIAQAALGAARLPQPPPMTETENRYLTGPGAPLAGMYRTSIQLMGRGWAQIAAMSAQIEHGQPAAARFARENVALYIESVYDGQFDLGQIQKRLKKGYAEVGGQAQLGGELTQVEVSKLEAIYSEKYTRLHPHVGVRLGS